MKVIFVPVADRPECMNALKIAFKLANVLEANVSGCHIRAHRYSNVALTGDSDFDDNVNVADKSASKDKTSKKKSIAAMGKFSAVAELEDYSLIKKPGARPGAIWQEKVGAPDKVMSIMGPLSDLIVVSRPAPKGGKLARVFMMAALLNSSRPVLVLPQARKSSVGKRISIAWNQSPEAAQAVAAAMPLLQAADEVNIITCGAEVGVGPKSSQLATYLKFWGVKTKRVKASGSNDAKAILQAYKDLDSDLLVMGAYSRSRLRQRIFGGVSEFMLQKANIPVFMLHI